LNAYRKIEIRLNEPMNYGQIKNYSIQSIRKPD
jgi:hypothetical protein